MDYTVLARRFRPQSFGEVVGQQNIASALKNAIAAGRVAHAYLFTGARGVGKTSTARILAKSLNCPQAKDGDPCNACEVCQAISVGHDVDVLEIDGASNRGIEDIRTLRSNVNVRAMRGRYKIYIIDEVHMLTRDAFNALLKTLEEPPANVKFIFATTEPHKLPDTILSRCQRFDFGTIATASIGERLAHIAAAEGVEVEPAALALVARRAAGSMRDSQSLFDQLLAFGGPRVTVADVHRLLGTAPDERLIALIEHLVARRLAESLGEFEAILNTGVQLGELTDQLLLFFRDLMVTAAGAGVELLSVAEDQRATLRRLANAWGLQTIVSALQILAEAKGRLRGVAYGRPLVELALLRIAALQDLQQLGSLVQFLREGKLPAGLQVATAEPAPAVSKAAPATPATPSATETVSKSALLPESVPVSEVPGKTDAPPVGPSNSQGDPATPVTSRPAGSLAEVDPAPRISASGSEPSEKRSTVQKKNAEPIDSDPGQASRLESSAPSAKAPDVPWETGRESEIWTRTCAVLTGMLQTHARYASPLAISGPDTLCLTVAERYNHYLEQNLERVEAAVAGVVGRPIRVKLSPDYAAEPPSPPENRNKGRAPLPPVVNDPLVKQALETFGGTLVRVETMNNEPETN